jgi:hypothetical protein
MILSLGSQAKLGILPASFAAGTVGWLLLRLQSARVEE